MCVHVCVQRVPVVAIASDVVRDEYGGVDEHVALYRYVRTQKDPATGVCVCVCVCVCVLVCVRVCVRVSVWRGGKGYNACERSGFKAGSVSVSVSVSLSV